MTQEFVSIDKLTDGEAHEMFKFLCINAIGSTEAEMKKELSIKGPVGIVDLIALIRSAKLDVEFTVRFDKVVKPVQEKEVAPPKKAEEKVTSESPEADPDALPF